MDLKYVLACIALILGIVALLSYLGVIHIG
jgi:hypothetical protein